MKILMCARCFGFHSFSTEWRFCECRNMAAKWIDPNAGTVHVLGRNKNRTFIIGMNNRFLSGAILSDPALRNDEAARELHNIATDAKGFLFDKSIRNCWAVVIRPGQTNDIYWHPAQEFLDTSPALTIDQALELHEKSENEKRT